MRSFMFLRSLLVLLSVLAVVLGSAHWDLFYSSTGSAPSTAGAADSSSVAYDYITNLVFVANQAGNRVDVFSLDSADVLTYKTNIPSTTFSFGRVKNVATHTGILAVSVEAADIVSPGKVLFFDTSSLQQLNSISVGSGPGHMAWSRTGRRLVVANSGRPNDNYSINPVGSISIIRLGDSVEFNRVNFNLLHFGLNVTNLNFTSYTQIGSIINSNAVRITGINATIATDLEPSFVTLNDFAYTPRAYITCQINNAFVEVDLIKLRIVRITALPFRDFNSNNNGFDASDADNDVNIAKWPVKGIPSPYGAAFFYLKDKHYLAFANQGLARKNAAYDEQRIVSQVKLDPNRFNVSFVQAPAALGDLVVSVNGADTNNDGAFDQLYAFGSRSISIWQLNTSNSDSQIYESGDSIERIIAASTRSTFNSAANAPNTFDVRSPYSGAEPSCVTIGKIDTHKLLFVGLSQQNTILVYSLSNPNRPRLVAYTGDQDSNPSIPVDMKPQDLLFLSSKKSPSGNDILIVANKLSGTTTVYKVVRLDPPATIAPTSWDVETAPFPGRKRALKLL